jgi:sulfhydrogenase subunit alpha
MSRTIVIDHLARVEGHGGVTVELDGEAVRQVRFDIFEGARLLETAVRGRRYNEVAPVASRICAICSAAHALTSLKATEQAFGVAVSPQTELLRELLCRGENIASHALHLFLLAAPDYLGVPDAAALAGRHPEAVLLGLRLKKLGNRIQEVIGGRAVHPVNAVVGGFARLPSEDDLVALHAGLRQGLADSEAAVDLIASLAPAETCRASPRLVALLSPDGYGYYAGQEVAVADDGARVRLPAAGYRTWLRECAVEHSHAKHSAVNGSPFMVGALARVLLRRERLSPRGAAALGKLGLKYPPASPLDNNKAQAVELVVDVEQALKDVQALLGRGLAPEPAVAVEPREGAGAAATEAPRGLLVHSYSYDRRGRLVAADVITPTAMNAASVEEHLRRTVERSPDAGDEALRRRLEMVVRAYDPCISCAVHLVRHRHGD